MNFFFILIIVSILNLILPCALAETQHLPENFLQRIHQDYLPLKNNMERAKAEDIRWFLQRYVQTPFETYVRKLWLMQLAKQQRWQEYEIFFKPSEDLLLTCYSFQAHSNLHPKEKKIARLSSLWLTGTSQPIICEQIFERLIKQGFINQQALWQRFQLAMEEHNIQLATRLAKSLSKDQHTIAQVWLIAHHHPEKLDRVATLSYPWPQKIIMHAIKKIADHDGNQASKLWQKYAAKYSFTPNEQYEIYRTLSLYLALQGKKEAFYWYQKLPKIETDLALKEWQIRAALLRQDWLSIQKQIAALTPQEQSLPIWRYWQARVFEKLNQPEKSKLIYQSLSNEKSFYGFLASYRLNKKITFRNSTGRNLPADLLLPAVSNNDLDYLKNLYQQGQHTDARLLLKILLASLDSLEKYALAQQLLSWGWYEQSIAISEDNNFVDDFTLRFPLAYPEIIRQAATQYKLSPSLVYAIIRQETTFQHDAKSPAEALGLMQLLPANAKNLALQLHIKLEHPYDLLHPENNIRLGSAYLGYLNKHLIAHPTLVASAYNVGITTIIKRWKKYPDMEIDLWIETLPWKETRNYIKNVITNFVYYQYQLGQPATVAPFLRKF